MRFIKNLHIKGSDGYIYSKGIKFMIIKSIIFVIGFVIGVLVGRKNRAIVEKAVSEVKEVEDGIKDKILKK